MELCACLVIVIHIWQKLSSIERKKTLIVTNFEHKELRAWVGKHYDPKQFSFLMHRIECFHHNAVS